jgi:nucleoside-diphosphate-sugar epimerase
MIGAALGSHISANYVEARLTDVRKSVLDNSKLRVQTGWAPKVGLQEGILATSNWISEQKFVIQG